MNSNSKSAIPLQHVYQDDYCQLSITATDDCIYQYYHQLPLRRECLIPSMEMVLLLARQREARGIAVFYLLEVLGGQLLPSEDITWLRKDVIPQLADAGIRYVAYVSENNLFRQFSQDNMVGTCNGHYLNLRIFQDRQDGLHWLD